MDHGDLLTLAGVLTEDATMTLTIAGEVEQGPFVGRAMILDLTRNATEAQTDQRRHNLTNTVFRRADAGTAVVWAYSPCRRCGRTGSVTRHSRSTTRFT